jgi:hypothetical protein
MPQNLLDTTPTHRCVIPRALVFDMSCLPHYEELVRCKSLSPEKLRERMDAVLIQLKNEGMVDERSAAMPVVMKFVENIAGQRDPAVRTYPMAYTPTEHVSSHQHFAHIRAVGFHAAHHTHSPVWVGRTSDDKSERSLVFPGVLNEDVYVKDLSRHAVSAVIVNKSRTTRGHLSHLLFIPENLLVNVTEDANLARHIEDHEHRHAQQIYMDHRNLMMLYYNELDADMAPASDMRQTGVGDEAIKTVMHARYMGLLGWSPRHWHAAAWEALENGKEPKDYYTTVRTILEIHARLQMARLGKKSKHIPSWNIQNAIGCFEKQPNIRDDSGLNKMDIFKAYFYFTDWSMALKWQDPSPLYVTLRRLVEDNVFTDSFVEGMARRILQAAAYFNPDFVTADPDASHRRMMSRKFFGFLTRRSTAAATL